MMSRYLSLALIFVVTASWMSIAAAEKPPVISSPLPTPTETVPTKGQFGAWGNGQPVAGGGPVEADSTGGDSVVIVERDVVQHQVCTIQQGKPMVCVDAPRNEGGEDEQGGTVCLDVNTAHRINDCGILAGRPVSDNLSVNLEPSVLWAAPVYPKLTFVYPDGSRAQLHEPEFARTHLSVAEGEAGGQCTKTRVTTVDGVDYQVLGMLQLLQDAPMRALEARMGFTQDDMLVCANNALVGEAWWVLTNRDWHLWVAKPKWRLE